MQHSFFFEEIDDKGVARLRLTRPDKHNAVNADLIAELSVALEGLSSDPRVRCLVLEAEGPSFSAGGDIAWMREMAGSDRAANLKDAQRLGHLLETLDHLPLPTVAAVHGAAIGAGLGLVACCDVVVAESSAVFAMPESHLGLVPGVIAPFLINTIGESAVRYHSLTGVRFDAEAGQRLGLVHRIALSGHLDSEVRDVTDRILRGAPGAQSDSKAQILRLRGKSHEADAVAEGAEVLADRRVSGEAKEGLSAFLEKRKSSWAP